MRQRGIYSIIVGGNTKASNKKLRYIAYVRKSEERTEKQILSHQAQTRKIKEQFPDLSITEWLEPESGSAFKPGRPVFDRMIQMVRAGKADGIVCYHPNRLSRNEVDAAEITYMLRTKVLKDLKFCAYTFEDTPEGVMMLQIVMSQSQYESSKQGRDVSRGMEEKALGGERPGVVPIGYMKAPKQNASGAIAIRPKDNKPIMETVKDPERYELVQRMWRMLLSNKYSPRQIRKIANEEWGFTVKKTAKTGGNPLGISSVYRMFTNPFYAGKITHNGELYDGNHEPMITLAEFDYAQRILGKRGQPRKGVHGYAYTGLIKCGECDCSVVAKTNSKYVKSEGRIKVYVHYYCTRKSEKRPCTQSKYTSLEDLEAEIDAELAKYTILPEFRDLALKILQRNHRLEAKDRSKIYATLQTKRQRIQAKLDKLVDMRTEDLLDDDEYKQQKNRLKSELERIDEELRLTEARADDWLVLSEKAFDFATYARVRFRNGDLETKRDILMALGENLVLKDKKLSLQRSEWLEPIGEHYPAVEAKYLRRVGTNKKATSTEKKAALEAVSEDWRAIRDSNPGHPA